MIACVHFTGMFSNRDAALGIWIAYVAVVGVTLIILEVLSFKSIHWLPFLKSPPFRLVDSQKDRSRDGNDSNWREPRLRDCQPSMLSPFKARRDCLSGPEPSVGHHVPVPDMCHRPVCRPLRAHWIEAGRLLCISRPPLPPPQPKTFGLRSFYFHVISRCDLLIFSCSNQ